MSRIRLRSKRHVSSIRVKQPNKTRVVLESVHSGEIRSIVVPPHTSRAAKGRQAGRGGEAGATEGENALARAEDVVEGVNVVVRSHGEAA